jgi:hypothetical protein
VADLHVNTVGKENYSPIDATPKGAHTFQVRGQLMSHLRIAALPLFTLLLAGQTVRSTHSGLVYFFDGYVFVGEEQLQQKFGRFPEIGEGRVLRTELGRAEVLLTPGVFLRVDENSAVRLLSDSLSDTRGELLRGSAILEVSHEAAKAPDTLIYKNWQVRAPQDSIARIDADPAQLRMYSGTAEVSAEDASGIVTVRRGEVLPFASALVPDQATTPVEDSFNLWAMNRSSVVREDNSIGAGITDDPDQLDTSGIALPSFRYFPVTGIPSLGISYPYGMSFWSPYQTWLNPYQTGLIYSRYPAGAYFYPRLTYPRPIGTSFGSSFLGRPSGIIAPRPSYPTLPRPAIAAPHVTSPHVTAPHVIRR